MALLNTIRFITEHPLNRGKRLSAIVRYLRWQVGSRLARGDVVYDWVSGAKFLVRTGETGLTGNIYTGLHEFPEMAFLLHYLRAEDLFIDVGANVGSYTILACSAVGARGVAFEPVPSVYQRLVENIRLNGLEESVQCVNKGVGQRQGEIEFTGDRDTMNHVLASGEPYDHKVTVDVVSLDAALAGEVPSLIKIDVEGYETPVLEGAQQLLAAESLNAVIMELNGSGRRYGFDEASILDLMGEYGFGTYAYEPFARKLINLEGKNVNSGNTLFLRDESFVRDRLATAPKVCINGRQF